jgi:protein-S-isoprenylcysteine O-methyltransferase Ste14
MHWTQILIVTALAIYILAFMAIMVAVRRDIGASPTGHDGGHHAAALLNTLATVVLLVTAFAYSFDARSVDWFGRIPLLDGPLAQILGAGALVLAGIFIVWGEASLGRSFRVALPESTQPLITSGIYRFTRNPLALSVDLLALGVLLIAPSWLALAGLILNVVSYAWKIRIEEAYLRQAHGAAYIAYCQQTGRYLPRLFHAEGGGIASKSTEEREIRT